MSEGESSPPPPSKTKKETSPPPSSDGAAVADKTIKRYALDTHRVTISWEAHAHSITCLAAAERLQLLCSGAEDGRICLWHVGATAATCAGTLSVRPHGSRAASSNLAIYALAVSPTGTVLFSGGADYRVHMFDLTERTLLHTLTGHASTVRALCFTAAKPQSPLEPRLPYPSELE